MISEVFCFLFFCFRGIRNEHLFQTEDQFCISVIYELSTFYIDFELYEFEVHFKGASVYIPRVLYMYKLPLS